MTSIRVLSICCLLLVPATVRGAELRESLAERLPLLGHRNWIVIADSAYPAQARPGIETIHIGGDQLQAVAATLQALRAARHVRPVVLLDAELAAVAEQDAPGVSQYREQLGKLVEGSCVQRLPHEEIIRRLDEAAKTFRILVFKTDLTIPYTTVFLELDCGYWNAEAEQRLRETLASGQFD